MLGRICRLSLFVLLVMSVIGTTAEAKPWVRKAKLDGLYVGKWTMQTCTWINCDKLDRVSAISWTFTPTDYGAYMHSNTGDYNLKLDYVEGLGYYRAKVRRERYHTAVYKMWVTQQIRVDGVYTAYKIEGVSREWARRYPKYGDTGSYAAVRKAAA